MTNSAGVKSVIDECLAGEEHAQGNDEIRRVLLATFTGYGALQPLFDDPDVEEIWINEPSRIFVARNGIAQLTNLILTELQVRTLVERMLTKARIDFAQADQRKSTQSLLGKLTGRERQVLERIVAGRLNKQIADDLSISIKTVEAHRANIMEKLNVNTVADLLRLALS
jgi:DNA-binding CsgD family transcriptional regulator